MCKDYRQEFLEWVYHTEIYPALKQEHIENALFMAKCWLNNKSMVMTPARYSGKSLSKILAIEFCWYIKDKQIRELKEKLEQFNIKPDKYVIVTNGWKKQVYGIAKITQEIRDIYHYCSDNYIGCYSPLTQYGEFETLEEAQNKLKQIKGEMRNEK